MATLTDEPFALVIFGASGDLTRRKLVPALWSLYAGRTLPEPFAIIGSARSEVGPDEFRLRMRDAVREFAQRRVAFIEDRFGEVAKANPELSPVEVLASVFTDEGYAAAVRGLPLAGEQLCQQHCPVSHVAHEFPQLCEAETEAIGRVLGRHVQRLATIAHGDGVCTTCIPHFDQQSLPPTQKESVTS